MSFEDQLDRRAGQIGLALTQAIEGFHASNVRDGMRHAIVGGKCLRGFLVMESAALFGVRDTQSIFPACAIEALHAYSLVHDDLPCMDDDDLRRGQPTVHVKWDEATAVLVGDALQTLAFDLITRRVLLPPEKSLELTSSLATAAHLMVRGQAMDIAAETAKEPLTLAEITELQALKTGALIEWSATVGPFIADEDPQPLLEYAEALGLAFQIADDILDVTGDEEKAGKRLQKDEVAGKATFVSHLGLEGAKKRAREMVAEALHALTPYNAEADTLREAARFVISREF